MAAKNEGQSVNEMVWSVINAELIEGKWVNSPHLSSTKYLLIPRMVITSPYLYRSMFLRQSDTLVNKEMDPFFSYCLTMPIENAPHQTF